MGIRLYMRNKYNPKNELCLGKLFAYADVKDKLKCVEYLNSIGAIGADFIEWQECYPDCKNLIDAFIDACLNYRYFDYGEFFQLSTAQCIKFLYLYRLDQKAFWENDKYVIDEMEIDFLEANEAIENMWEFQLDP